ncbi:hypothetical protein [Leifsonia sp. P73]|uniref:hypothetical protein n=1 Tax=Leifsonia sp. P73 TaxID=3423959 RepID=UPI003DA4A140
MTFWFPDTSVIVNFGHLDQLDLLRGHLRGNGKVTQAVSAEIAESANWVTPLTTIDQQEWFGEPIEVPDDEGAIEGIRVHRFGGERSKPKQHLGESETLYVIQFVSGYSDAVWITKDKSAYQFGKTKGIVTRNTFDILCEMVAFGDISSADAFAWATRLDGMDRLFYCPTSASDFG